MKNLVVFPVLLSAMVIAIYLFTVKFDSPSDVDKVQIGLKGIDKYLSAGSSVVLVCNTPGEDFIPNFVNYFLAPISLKSSAGSKDTTLFLLPLGVADANVNAQLSNSIIIWKNQDDRFQYILATAKDGAK
jgi:hypothetical protein